MIIKRSFASHIKKLGKQSLADEKEIVQALLKDTNFFDAVYPKALAQAKQWVKEARATKPRFYEQLLHQFHLHSDEGRALISLSEAFLRIPDKETQGLLIESMLESAEWKGGEDSKESLITKSSRLAMRLIGTIARLSQDESIIKNIAGKTLLSLSSPVTRTVLKEIIEEIGKAFVLGENISQAMLNAKRYENKGYLLSYDMLGESARTEAQAKYYLEQYIEAIKNVSKDAKAVDLKARSSVSVKLSALFPRFELLKHEDVFKDLLLRLKELALQAKKEHIMLTVDAEDHSKLDITLLLFEQLISDKELSGFNGIGIAVQAYHKQAYELIDVLAELARKHKKQIPIRLVKGAYWDSEIKNAQVQGTEAYPVFTRKEYTDVSYLACAKKMLDYGELFYPQFATHNAMTISAIHVMAKGKNVELQKLFGMADVIHDQVVKDIPCRIYAPVGPYEDLLPYLLRRLLENGSSSSFLYQLAENKIALTALLANPFEKSKINESKIPLPKDIYGKSRKNSLGNNIANLYELETLNSGLEKYTDKVWEAASIINGKEKKEREQDIYNPADLKELVGTWGMCGQGDIDDAMEFAKEGFKIWSNTDVNHRAKVLEKFAELIESRREEFISLAMREAGKTLADAISEVREAVDYTRYYADEAKKLFNDRLAFKGPTGEYNSFSFYPRGIFCCISPWNFPLAIFCGQITAALATGNAVIAKPAEQTPLISHLAVQLMHKAGVPEKVVQLILGDGEVGKRLVADKHIAGVVFTGSNETAWKINQTLANKNCPIVPLIAETGGQNCMVVDSSALPEQAADDIIRSAFASAGQRCSALRVLFIQEEIADRLIEIITGAIHMFRVGNPKDFSVDMGPVIDANAKNKLQEHIEKMKREAKILFSGTTHIKDGNFIAPHIFEIDNINILEGEVFGPILHIIRYKKENLDAVIDQINSTGYGLTFGLHSRIPERAEQMHKKICAGNFYVNRSMIGATVGVQPFGGEGLSGTGFKAGGPNYLLRFVTERTFTVNLTAIGGDTALLSEQG